MAIPVYAFSGFLDAGKTRFLQETLEDERFNAGEKTLLLVGEEGEEAYEPETFSGANVHIHMMDQETVTEAELEALQKKYHAERVCVELNGMQMIGDFYNRMPKTWVLYQELMFAEANTFPMYNANMRQLTFDKVSGCEMVVFNRVDEHTDKLALHKIIRAINRRCDIAYEDAAGEVEYDNIVDPLPFDLHAPIIEIQDDDFGLFYRDITEEQDKYAKKTVRFKAQVAQTKKVEAGCFVPGRFIMTCCEADITFMGLACKWPGAETLKQRSWVWVTAKVSLQYSKMYKDTGPVLTALSVEPAEAPAEEVVTF